MERPPVWKMIKEAVGNLNENVITYTEIKEYINAKWTDVKSDTITVQIIALTVNHKSRIHYQENNKPRLSNSNSPYDLLYTIGRGQIVKYDVIEHGIWEIFKNENEKLDIRPFAENSSVKTYLFVWNPNKWNWTTLEQNIEQLENNGKVIEKWSCISHKSVKSGDRAFLARVGSEPRGIFAAGYVASEPFLSKHWSGEEKDIYRVLIDFEVLINPEKEPILTLDILNVGNLEKQQWTPQSSGISVKPELVDELEAVWFNFLTTQKIRYNPYGLNDSETSEKYTEGTVSQVTQTKYERNPYARTACIKYYGYKCSVCEFDFKKQYGELGANFIHVHHLTKISTIGQIYEVDPIKDLRPVCPNCHAMLHRQDPPLTIENLKNIIADTENENKKE
jgi:5-methylcytosine-specific restriction enzyme A